MHPSAETVVPTRNPLSTERVAPVYVLIVDDDPDFLDLLTDEIGQIQGVHIDVAHNPVEALKYLTQRDYELVVSDWALDKSTGPEVLNTADGMIEGENPAVKTPVLFISGSDKVGQTQVLRALRHFEPVSFIRKSCGPPLIGLLAEHILMWRERPSWGRNARC